MVYVVEIKVDGEIDDPIALSSDEKFFTHAENAGYNLRMRCVE